MKKNFKHDQEDLIEACGFTEDEFLKIESEIESSFKETIQDQTGQFSKFIEEWENKMQGNKSFIRYLLLKYTTNEMENISNMLKESLSQLLTKDGDMSEVGLLHEEMGLCDTCEKKDDCDYLKNKYKDIDEDKLN